MKKIFLFLFLIAILFTFNQKVYAAEPTIAITPTNAKEEVINDLKERIASRVAQLKLVEKRGVVGTVTDISDTQITLSDPEDKTRFIDVDEITKFASPAAKGSFGISDIKKGTQLGILGLYNKQSRRILARFVDTINTPKSIHGIVTSIDEENFSFTITTDENEEKTVDVEKITKTSIFTKDSGIAKAGFSKIKTGETVFAKGFFDIKNKNQLIATRIIVFPEIPKNPKINFVEKALLPQENSTPSTGSGKKLTPITK